MDFNFTQEQQQFADALQRWAAKDYGFEQRGKIVYSEAGVSDAAWATLTELGMTALPIPEAQGGFSGSAIDMLVVMQELGRALVVEPYLATVLGAEFLKRAGGHEALLEKVASGELKLACALGEKQSRHDLFDIATTSRSQCRRLAPERRQDRGHPRRPGRCADRLGAQRRRPARHRRHFAVRGAGRCRRRDAPRLPHHRRPARGRHHASTTCSCRHRRCWARPAPAGMCWTRWPTTARPCCARKRSARWRP